MNTATTIAELAGLALTVTVRDGNLELDYTEGALTTDLIVAIRANKAELVTHYRLGPRPTQCGWCGYKSFSPRFDGRAWICDACHPVSPSQANIFEAPRR